jgi:hypothetical protein
MTWLQNVRAKYPTKDKEFNASERKRILDNYKSKKLPKLEKQRQEILSKSFHPNTTWWGSKTTID